LIGGLVIFVPLYGCPALLIREVARRAGLGWPGMVLMAAAFGLLQAGVVDQSLFSTDYRQIEGWNEGYRATLIAPLGISAFNLLNFVGGHVIFSICAPVALVEAARPAAAGTAWLSRRGLAITAVVYAAASALVLRDHLVSEASHASILQVALTSVLVVGLVAAAFRAARRPGTVAELAAPSVGVVFAVALVLAVLSALAPDTWVGVGITLVTFVAAGLGLGWGSRRRGGGVRHVAMVAAAPLLVRALLAFTSDPLVGQVSSSAKYWHNAVMLAVVLLAAASAVRRSSRTGR
jgi:hypothetical protein